MRLLVTGGQGQVARALVAAGSGFDIVHVGRPDFDFDRPETLAACIARAAPDLVINAAAWTAVDAAETERAAAWRANATGPGIIARECAARAIPLLHISTDYVFDGTKPTAYVEDDTPNPTGAYGASKLAGEQEVLASGARALILRTAWVYAVQGRNFVRTMLGAARKTDHLRVVADQTGCPTLADDLAAALLAVARSIGGGWRDEYAGIYHAAGSGAVTWHGFALAIFEEAARHGLRPPRVDPIATADWPTPARRPENSRLDCARLSRTFGVALPPWRGSLAGAIDRIFAAGGV